MAQVTTKFEEKDLGWKRIQNDLKRLNNSYTDVGLFGNGSKDPNSNIAYKGVIHEFGSDKRNIPSRPFERTTFDNNINDIQKFIINSYSTMLTGTFDVRKTLSSVGEWFTGKMKKTIVNYNWKALSLITILKKKSSKPLIDTGEMRNAIKHKEKIN